MSRAVAQILAEVERLSQHDRADLADGIIEILFKNTLPEVEQAQLNEVRRRIVHVESGQVTLVPGEQALAQVRRFLPQAPSS